MKRLDGNTIYGEVIKAVMNACVDTLNEYDPEELAPVYDEATLLIGEKIAKRTADNLVPEVQAALAERDAYREMIETLLKSAHPHPIEHPTMTRAWETARNLLDSPPMRKA